MLIIVYDYIEEKINMKNEHNKSPGQYEDDQKSRRESIKNWLAAVSVGALSVGGGLAVHEAVTDDNRGETPVLTPLESEDGGVDSSVQFDQFGNQWVRLTIPEGSTIQTELGDREMTQRTLQANGIVESSDVKANHAVWVPSEALED